MKQILKTGVALTLCLKALSRRTFSIGMLATGVLSIGTFCPGIVTQAAATEGGQTNWASGVQTIYPALTPAPGQTLWQDYFVVNPNGAYSSTSRKSAVPGFRATAIANAARLFHSWHGEFLGATISSSAILAINSLTLRAGGQGGTAFGANWLYLAPLYLSWHTPKLHIYLGEGAFLPIGSFSKTDVVSESTHVFGFNQEAALTWMPTKRFDVSAEGELQINTKNGATDYKSGNVINIDFGANYMLTPALPQLRLGLNGFVTSQFTNDVQKGRRVGDGNRLAKYGLGPQLIWFFKPPYAVAFKWQHEMGVQNSTRGDRYWVQFQMPL
ncbi:SphA family protein [Asaia siamensis]|uniref:Phenol degradation protein meta n=1 Tax=Asaia siamensis TaxID=110479 RepID=A0ABQ1LPY6_9PROT|nr:transporter [Asaia siamensis]GBR05526.1 hypothetical protein AA0323_1073 [Asaia siamensis NRIC 0323]GGC27747.1 hypothetical protein GCM10007207_11490 [Asaia siamensis]